MSRKDLKRGERLCPSGADQLIPYTDVFAHIDYFSSGYFSASTSSKRASSSGTGVGIGLAGGVFDLVGDGLAHRLQFLIVDQPLALEARFVERDGVAKLGALGLLLRAIFQRSDME